MGSKTLFTQVASEKSIDDVKVALKQAFQSVGGLMIESPRGIEIKQGVNGVSFAFAADVSAQVNIRQVNDRLYEIECTVSWKMSALSIICLIIGLFMFGILWIVPLLYLFVNPEFSYQQSLQRVQTYVQ
jgi:hypothetical protein